MNKAKLLRAVNILLFISFIIQAVTGVIFALGIRVPYLRALAEIHEYNGLILAAVACVHILLNFGWIKANFFTKRNA